MGVERLVAAVRGRRTMTVVVGLLALVLAGSVVAMTEQSQEQTGAVLAEQDEGSIVPATPKVAGAPEAQALRSSSGASSASGAGGSVVANASGADLAAPPSTPGNGPSGPKVVKTANLRVEVGKGRFQSAFMRAARVAEQHGGFVASSSQATVDEKASEGSVTIRVPVANFEAARAAVAGLGTVRHLELSGQDVTSQIVDYDARIRNLQAQEQALATLLARAASTGEILEIQSQLFGVRQQVEQLQAERTNLDGQASMATITATVFEPGAALAKEPEGRTGLARSWERAWAGAVAVVGGTVIVLGYVVPLAVLVLLAWAVWRLANRRRTAAVTPAA
jgi:hypothetical protein